MAMRQGPDVMEGARRLSDAELCDDLHAIARVSMLGVSSASRVEEAAERLASRAALASLAASRGKPAKTLRVRVPLVLDVTLRAPDAVDLAAFQRALRARLDHYSDGRRPVAMEACEALVEPLLRDVAIDVVGRSMLAAGQPNDGSAFRIAAAIVGDVIGSARVAIHRGENDSDPDLDADFATSTSDPTPTSST